jgi:hypothetical protein
MGISKKIFARIQMNTNGKEEKKKSIPLLFTFTMHTGVRNKAVETKMIRVLS